MKRIFTKTLSTLIIALFFHIHADASHFAGSEITYTCLGGNTYLITMSFYRDCSGIAEPTTVPIQFNCSSISSFNFSATLTKIPGTGQEVTPACSAAPTHCNGGNNYGIREYIYQAQVTLIPCNSWTMTYSSCCRNPITTTSASGGWYMIAELNNLYAPCNSSPVFSNKPVSILCNGQPVCYNPGAIDLDGDSLVYSFFAPKTSSTSTINYLAGYSYTNFLNSSTPITINPQTGDICFTPNSNLITAAGIKVEEWRRINGTPTLIGTIYRDIQIKVIFCNSNTLPQLSGMDTSLSQAYSVQDTTYYMEVCLGSTIDFDINGFDADTFNAAQSGHPEEFSISWNQGIQGAYLLPHNDNTDSAYAYFNWTPTSSDVSNTPKCFTTTITDNACPYNGSQSFSYCIKVKGISVDLYSDRHLCKGENIDITAYTSSGVNSYSWRWDGQPINLPVNQNYFTVNTSNYSLGGHSLSVEINKGLPSQCPKKDSIGVFVYYKPVIINHMPDTTFCGNQTIIYDAGISGVSYEWKLGVGWIYSYAKTLNIKYPGKYILTVYDNSGIHCANSDTFFVHILTPPPPFSFGNDTTIATNQSLTLTLPSGYPAYHWNTGVTSQAITIDNSYLWQNKIIGSVAAQNQCKTSDTIMVYIGSVGIGDNYESNHEVKIYPNPVEESLIINLSEAQGKSEVSIFDVSGKLLIRETFTGKSYEMKSVRNLAAGSYFLRINNKVGEKRIRFVKQ